jgi:predicted enzyme related to lactoylglutathione lyase
MSTRLVNVVLDAQRPVALAGFWAELLGWEVVGPQRGGPAVTLRAPDGERAFDLVLVPAAESKSGKNRLHLDLASTSARQQESTIRAAVGLGAVRTDIGQTGVPWDVLVDPEGNEFCVLEPRAEYATTGTLAAVVVDTADAYAVSGFWAAATGWSVAHRSARYAALHDDTARGPWLEFVHDEAVKRTRNRLHLELAPVGAESLPDVTRRLSALGAQPLPAEQGCPSGAEVTLNDPQGNEFCVRNTT